MHGELPLSEQKKDTQMCRSSKPGTESRFSLNPKANLSSKEARRASRDATLLSPTAWVSLDALVGDATVVVHWEWWGMIR